MAAGLIKDVVQEAAHPIRCIKQEHAAMVVHRHHSVLQTLLVRPLVLAAAGLLDLVATVLVLRIKRVRLGHARRVAV